MRPGNNAAEGVGEQFSWLDIAARGPKRGHGEGLRHEASFWRLIGWPERPVRAVLHMTSIRARPMVGFAERIDGSGKSCLSRLDLQR